MTGITLDFPFKRSSDNPIDVSFVLSKAEMLAMPDSEMPDNYFAVCKDDGKFYLFDKSATPSAETGKFTAFQGGDGNTYSFSLTQAAYDALSEDEKNSDNIYFVTDGSAADSLIGRWEKIVELHGSEIPTTQTIDFSKYNAITITSVAPFGEVNECFTTVEDFAVGRKLTTSYFDLNPDQNRTVTIERTGANTISISNANGMGICIYGYKDTGLSSSDVSRIADEVSGVISLPSGGSAGQYLAKKSAADGDAEWKTPDNPLGDLPSDNRLIGTWTDPDGYKHDIYERFVYVKNFQLVNNEFSFEIQRGAAIARSNLDKIVECSLSLETPYNSANGATIRHALPGVVYEPAAGVNKRLNVTFKTSFSGTGMLVTGVTHLVITSMDTGSDLAGSVLTGRVIFMRGGY